MSIEKGPIADSKPRISIHKNLCFFCMVAMVTKLCLSFTNRLVNFTYNSKRGSCPAKHLRYDQRIQRMYRQMSEGGKHRPLFQGISYNFIL
jgi:hypothetical protein